MELLGKLQPILKTGQEQFHYKGTPLQMTLFDFWRWSVSDIMSNATRGILAEFIVASATLINLKTIREEWGAFDLETPDGIKLEIKSSAYLQTWHQENLSKISFGIRETYGWNSSTNKYGTQAQRHADVYVFCLLHHGDKQTVDPLNMNQWCFYVLPTVQINNYTRSKHSITLKSLETLTSQVTYENLSQEIKQKNILNNVSKNNEISTPKIEQIILEESNILHLKKGDINAHEILQDWRNQNLQGYLINFKSYNNAVLHKTICKHLGDTTWEAEKNNWGSMGNTDKVCSNNKIDLLGWAEKNLRANLKICGSCNP